MMASIKQQWFSNVRADILSGMTVALALIPEALAFSIIAGVDPMVGLYASFCMAIVIAFTGGRPAMISAATGAMSLLMINLVKDHGIEYLFAATVFNRNYSNFTWCFESRKVFIISSSNSYDWICKCARYFNFYSTASPFSRSKLDDVRNGSRNAAHRLFVSAHDQSNTISACCHCLDDDCSDWLSFRFKNGRRYGEYYAFAAGSSLSKG